MIIQVRGTSGSGKSTVMRHVMDRLGTWDSVRAAGRKAPLYYQLGEDGGPSIAVLGHYESACGGCDTIGSAPKVYELIKELEPKVVYILAEGLLLSEDVKWSSQLSGLRVVFLTTPLDKCLHQIGLRRREAGNSEPVDPRNTTNRVAVIERARVKLTEAGVYCRRASAHQAPGLILDWINGRG